MESVPPGGTTNEEKVQWLVEQTRYYTTKPETLASLANAYATLALADQVKRVADLLERSPLERGSLLIGDADE